MSDIERAMQDAAAKAADLQTRLQNIFIECYALNNKDMEPGYAAWGMLAVDVSVRLAKLFLAVKHDKGVHEVACDLTYQLNTNEFWQKNAAVLMPVMHVALNTHRDGILLLADRANRNEYSSSDALISASRAAPLEIFPVIAYLVGGPALMVASSLKLKQNLAPYFLG